MTPKIDQSPPVRDPASSWPVRPPARRGPKSVRSAAYRACMADQAPSLTDPVTELPPGVPGYPGPFPVGRVAGRIRDRLREVPPVCVIGEGSSARTGAAGPNVYFELRDAYGALPCAMWRDDFERCRFPADELRDGAEVVA